MSPLILPANKVYRCVDDELATITMARIREKFATLLSTGAQSGALPDGLLAAGQYLDQPDFDQRGLFGTAAAILVHAGGRPDDASLKAARALIEYLRARPEVEPALARDEHDRADMRRKIRLERIDTFKTADVVYALSFVPAIVSGKDALLRELVDRVQAARLPAGGWATQLAADRTHDPFATAHVLRALHAVGAPMDPVDVRTLVDALATPGDPYARTFLMSVLLDIGGGEHTELVRAEFARVVGQLREQCGTYAEANFEYTIGKRQYYVRVPWQLYLIQVVLGLSSGLAFFSAFWQKQLLGVVERINSPEGFVYAQSGHAQSTRTYGIVFDLMRRVAQRCRSATWFNAAGGFINRVTRVADSGVTQALVVVAGIAVVVVTTVRWFGDDGADAGELAPNFLAAAVVALLQWGLLRAKR
ncbi:hypothetical protein ACFPM7_13625 [Actinokineospora guangxiensis]|uniref:Uncharacterized protein n=1 Tax=Actinokineospora guangxiensis TaxID=1490288 RepID=A0ABW0EPU3_9PSEU